MKRNILTTLVALFITTLLIAQTRSNSVEIGSKYPLGDRKMEATSGVSKSLNDVMNKNGLCLIFSCNTCPFVIAWEDRYNELNELSAKNEIGFALINSNEAKRSGDDSMVKMKAHEKEKGYKDIFYAIDNNHELADALGATSTPHVYLFDGEGKLVYKGAIDDNLKDASAVKEQYLSNAIKNMVQEKPIEPNSTKAIGCSIKRVM